MVQWSKNSAARVPFGAFYANNPPTLRRVKRACSEQESGQMEPPTPTSQLTSTTLMLATGVRDVAYNPESCAHLCWCPGRDIAGSYVAPIASAELFKAQ